MFLTLVRILVYKIKFILQLKNPPTATSSQRQSSERSNKGSRERSLPLLRSPENPRPHSKTEAEEQADTEATATEEPVLAQGGELSAEEFSGEKYNSNYFIFLLCKFF